jgi:uncharacterized protein (DUF1015 family)
VHDGIDGDDVAVVMYQRPDDTCDTVLQYKAWYKPPVPRVLPFKGVHYSESFDLNDVTAPPYDVISPEERNRLASLHPNNFVHLTLPDDGADRYVRAGETLRGWFEEGVLAENTSESLYLYEAQHRQGTIAGIICLIELERFDEGSVHPHEKTMPGPKADRLEIMRHTRANLEPLWFIATKDIPAIKTALDEVEGRPPIAEAADKEGVRHRVRNLDTSLAEDLSSTELVVADGHHRYETAITYRDEQGGKGPWNYTLALVSSPTVNAPVLRPTHRVVDELSAEALAGLVSLEPFQGTISELAERAETGTIGFARGEHRWTFPAGKGLDTEYLAELLGRLELKPEYEHDVGVVEHRVEGGSAAFLLAPVPISTVIDYARAGRTMPPKTTLFWPKPRSGLVFRLLTQA